MPGEREENQWGCKFAVRADGYAVLFILPLLTFTKISDEYIFLEYLLIFTYFQTLKQACYILLTTEPPNKVSSIPNDLYL